MPVVGNRIKVASSSTGTGNITLGSAEDGFQTFADGGISNNDVVRYVITEGSSFEIGKGTYLTSGPTLTRTSGNLLESSTGSLLNLSGSATVFVSLADTDVMQTDGGTIEGFVGIGTQYTVPQGPSYALDIKGDSGATSGSSNIKLSYGDNVNNWLNISDQQTVSTVQARNKALRLATRHDDNIEFYRNNASIGAFTSSGLNVVGTVTDDGATHDGDVVFTGSTVNITFDQSADAIRFDDLARLYFGASSDLTIYHNSVDNHSYIVESGTGNLRVMADNLRLQNTSGNDYIEAISGGAVKIMHNSSTKLTTSSSGISVNGTVTADGLTASTIATSSGDLTVDVAGDIILDADDGDIKFSNGGTLFGSINSDASSPQAMRIQSHVSDGDIIFKGNDAGVTVTALTLDMSDRGTAHFNHDIVLEDYGIARFGDSNDLQIFHNSSHTYVANATGNFYIRNSADDQDVIIECDDGAGGLATYFLADGSTGEAVLHHYGNQKLATQTGGISVTGDMLASGKIGLDSTDYITFTDNTQMDVYINGSNEFRFEADGDFHADGNVIAYSTTIASDASLKENIQPVTGLESVMALDGVSFDWKRDGKKSAGVIAQQVQKIMPEAVTEVKAMDGSKHLSVNYNALTSVLVEAIKDLKAEIEDLKNASHN